jgi:hypothetical protein
MLPLIFHSPLYTIYSVTFCFLFSAWLWTWWRSTSWKRVWRRRLDSAPRTNRTSRCERRGGAWLWSFWIALLIFWSVCPSF